MWFLKKSPFRVTYWNFYLRDTWYISWTIITWYSEWYERANIIFVYLILSPLASGQWPFIFISLSPEPTTCALPWQRLSNSCYYISYDTESHLRMKGYGIGIIMSIVRTIGSERKDLCHSHQGMLRGRGRETF